MRKKSSDDRRRHGRITIKNNLFASIGSSSTQNCIVLDISEGGMALRYYEGSDLINEADEDKSARLDIIVDKGELCLDKVPYKTVYDAEIKSEMPIESVSIRRRGIRFGRMSKEQRSKLKDLVHNRLTK